MVARNTISGFLERCEVNNETGCWEWTGGVNAYGYGRMKWEGKLWYAHRLSLKLSGIEVPEDMCVCHHCDNRRCINPDHLFMGTHADNMRDRDEKGRAISFSGEDNGMSKLTASEVLEIKHRYETEDIFQKDLAEAYGVSRAQIGKICSGESWRDSDEREILEFA